MKNVYIAVVLFGYVSSMFAWEVVPISQEVTTDKDNVQITVDNSKYNTPVAVRIKPMARDMNDKGQEVLSETNDLRVFPRQMIIEPKQKSIIRISIKNKNNTDIEKAYRVVIDQLPARRKANDRGAQVLTRYVTSVYLTPNSKKTNEFTINNAQLTSKGVVINAQNNGNHHKVLYPGEAVYITEAGETFEVSKEFDLFNILPQKSAELLLPIKETVLSKLIQHSGSLRFRNICKSCAPDEFYEIVVN